MKKILCLFITLIIVTLCFTSCSEYIVKNEETLPEETWRLMKEFDGVDFDFNGYFSRLLENGSDDIEVKEDEVMGLTYVIKSSFWVYSYDTVDEAKAEYNEKTKLYLGLHAYSSVVRINSFLVCVPETSWAGNAFKDFMEEVGIDIPRENLLNENASVRYDKSLKSSQDIFDSLEALGYTAYEDQKYDDESIRSIGFVSEDGTHFFDVNFIKLEKKAYFNRRKVNSNLSIYTKHTRMYASYITDGLLYFMGTTTNTDELWESIK